MGNKLVIVESPAKARTIGKILGNSYILTASMGHVRDLPEKTLGVKIDNNFQPEYVVTRQDTIKSLNNFAKSADEIYLATDPDREGEAIAWHLQEVLSQKAKANFFRVEFHEITKSAINKAFDSPRQIDVNLVDAQQARRILDRLVGYQVSPLLWSKIERGISAGRVQSVALRIVCEREREIESFVPKEYWNFTAHLLWKNDAKNLFDAKLLRINEKKAEVPNKETADKIYTEIKSNSSFDVDSVKIEPVKKYAPPPFITSTLQQAAGAAMRFPANKTMRVAQQLYEGIDVGGNDTTGLITYMRTDSFTISKEAQNSCREFIAEAYGQRFVPSKPNKFKNKSTAQEAHEAIRPTDVTKMPKDVVSFLDRDQLNLYRLIWNRFVASQMAPAEITRTTVDCITVPLKDKYTFRTIANVTEFPGFTKVTEDKTKENVKKEDQANSPGFLNDMKAGDKCSLDKLEKVQKFTEPPPRYTEPSLIRELEGNGIGRPSTYATTVNTIQKRKYVEKEKGKLIPQELGFKVNDYLVSTLPDLLNIGFTAEMEDKLDNIEQGQEQWTEMLQKFYDKFSEWLDLAKYKFAPEKGKVEQLFSLMDRITTWALPEKVGRRTYNDRTFFNSIKKQFEKNNKLSEKQWESMLKLAIKYSGQLPALEKVADEYSFLEEMKKLEEQVVASEEERRKRQQSDKEGAMVLLNVLTYFDNVKISEPEDTRFSQQKFLDSLRERARENKPITPKQSKVLARIAVDYKKEIANFDELAALLSISTKDINASRKSVDKTSSQNPEIKELFAKFENFNGWAEPVQKGKRVFDDKAFYLSLKKQFEERNSLSPKQIAVLKKMDKKYFK